MILSYITTSEHAGVSRINEAADCLCCSLVSNISDRECPSSSSIRTRSSRNPHSPLHETLVHDRLSAVCQKMAEHDVPGSSSTGGSATENAPVALFTLISPPILRSIDSIQESKVFKVRERYELEVASKQSEIRTLQTAPYTESIDWSLLKHLVYMGSFDDPDPKATAE